MGHIERLGMRVNVWKTLFFFWPERKSVVGRFAGRWKGNANMDVRKGLIWRREGTGSELL